MTIKHNKLKNSGLLFELLVRQIAADTLNNKESKAIDILKKYYNNTDVLKEYKLYHTLSNSRNLSEVKASMLIQDCIKAYGKLNKNNLRKQKYDLIAEIKANYDIEEFFKTKVDNYKILASTYLLLEMESADAMDQSKYTNCKVTLLEHIVSSKEETKNEVLEQLSQIDKGTRAAVYKIMVNKFNDKYSSLNEGQKEVLSQYINNITTTEKLKEFYDGKISHIKKELTNIIKEEKDAVRKVKLQETYNIINPVKTVTDADVNNILCYLELIKEYENVTKS